MRIVFAGTPAAAVPSLRAFADSGHDLVAVVTRPDARAGRGRTLQPSPVKVLAGELGVPVLTPASAKDSDFHDQLRELAPDVCPVVAYGSLIPRAALDIPTMGWVNLHFSLLPAWRGAAPVQHAVIHGDEVTGATTFLLDEGMDTGAVLGTMTEAIRPRDTSGELLTRLAQAGAGLLLASVDGLADGSITPVAQPPENVSTAPKITTADAEINWHHPAFAVDRQIRGCTPAPGAWTTFRGERLRVGPPAAATPSAEFADVHLAPGELHVAKKVVLVGTGSTALPLGEVQAHGKKLMQAADWARGSRIDTKERLG
ncbi:methionyl-tRNA formyltransferase [Rudaeicoccus suwonensis]|uniref:Methionyl-tRNA formyltransferase n=1 Tax=Rudaeicoccus suwonensis TaxID=657409 RepID=A0A561EAB0_9MICO|nr:methionyl-tRNA formyltransferase [Rudaeicoccus suwonensis]TWE12539.1 methionyl-tRNA formyltransferase [Rudaeicoccus suwonensis]